MKGLNEIYGCGFGPAIYTWDGSPIVAPVVGTPVPNFSMPPAPLDDPSGFPALYDIAFYPPDQTRGASVGGAFTRLTPATTGGCLVYVTTDGGTSWTYVPVAIAPNITNAMLTRVRFTDKNTAWAIGNGADMVTNLPIPLLVKITIP
jgi:hypothetical protein